jgi:hypothetical protein
LYHAERQKDARSLGKWAGVCPGNNESAGKRKKGKTPPGNKALKSTLAQCAQAAKNTKNSFFGAQYNRLVSHLGKKQAVMAVAHSLLIALYFVLQGNHYKDLGADYYNRFNRQKKISSHIKQLSKLGVNIPDDILRDAIRAPPGC